MLNNVGAGDEHRQKRGQNEHEVRKEHSTYSVNIQDLGKAEEIEASLTIKGIQVERDGHTFTVPTQHYKLLVDARNNSLGLGVKRIMQRITLYAHIDKEQLRIKGEKLMLGGDILKNFMHFTEIAISVAVDTKIGKVSGVKVV